MSNTTLPDIRSADVAGKRVLVRADLNVPMADGKVSDATRLERFAPSVLELSRRGAIVFVMTHMGRPKGKPDPALSTRPVAAALEDILGQNVLFLQSPEEAADARLKDGDVVMLENLRFDPGETTNDEVFAARLANIGHLYVNDAFSCAHRAHASTHALAELLPAYAGPALLAEVEALERILEKPERPAAALVGGAKISTKVDVLVNLVKRVDYLIVGGGMANTFLAANGAEVGKSLCETDAFDTVRRIMDDARQAGCEIVLPLDLVVATEFAENAENREVAANDIPADMMALDAGSKSIEAIGEILEKCRSLLWNGPLGAFEIAPFGKATFAVAGKAAALTKAGKLLTVAGGGDTAAALNAAGVADDFTYMSAAGGAFLEWLEGKPLPGIEILKTVQTKLEDA